MKILKKILPISFLLIYFIIVSTIHLLVEKKHIIKQEAAIVLNKSEDNKSLFGINHKNIMVELDADAYMKDYIFIGDTAKITSILFNGIYLNKNLFVERDKNFTATYYDDLINAKNKVYSIKNSLQLKTSLFFYFKNFINWKGDFSFMKNVLVSPLVLFTFIFFSLLYLYKKFGLNFKKNKVQIEEFKMPFYFIWLPFLLLFFIIFYNDIYYFLQDDNYSQFTPILLNGLDGWYQQGTFPTYTPLQFNGVATFEYSTYSFLYPITHLSYLVAKHILHNSYQFNNVFAFIHFAIGYYFFIKLLRLFKINFLITVVAALGFIFCGFNLETTRSWYYVAPTIAFLPLLIYIIFVFSNKKLVFKNYIIAILVLTIYAYSGNFQFWLYTIIFCSILYVYVSKDTFKNFLFKLLGIVIPTLILFLPQIVTTITSLENMERVGGQGEGITQGINDIFIPFVNTIKQSNNKNLFNYIISNHHFYYGSFFLILLSFSLILYYGTYFNNFLYYFKKRNLLVILILIFFLAFILALGFPGLIWIAQSKIPIFNKFNHPFKFFIYVQFFGILSGAIIANYFLINYSNKIFLFAFSLLSFLYIINNVCKTKEAFFNYNYKTNPYNKLPFVNLLDTNYNYRVIPLSTLRSTDSFFSNTLQMNFSMMQNIASTDGYEPFFNNENDNFNNHRDLGIRYFIVSKHKPSNIDFEYLYNGLSKFKDYKQLRKIYSDSQIDILEDTLSEPLIQLYHNNTKCNSGIKITNKNNGAYFNIYNYSTIINKVMLNYTYNENIFIKVNGVPIKKEKDSFNRMVIYPNTLINTIEFKYISKPFSYLYK